MNTQTITRKSVNVRRMTVIAILSAISILMSMLPFIGYIPIGPMKATIMHVPVIIGAVIEGPAVGAAIGLIFGLTSLWNAITQPVLLSPLFLNPLVSVLPRILIGITSYYSYKFIYKMTKKVYASGFVAGIVGSLTNTIGVLGMIYILYADKYLQLLLESGSDISQGAAKLLLGIVVGSGIPEAIVAGFIVAAVSLALIKKAKK